MYALSVCVIAHFRSSIGSFSALPAKIGRTLMVTWLQGLLGLECAIVSFMLRPSALGMSSDGRVDRGVPSGSTTPTDDAIADMAGRLTELARDAYDVLWFIFGAETARLPACEI